MCPLTCLWSHEIPFDILVAIYAVLCSKWKKWWLKRPNLEIIRAKIVGEKHKLVFLVVVICYLVVVNWL